MPRPTRFTRDQSNAIVYWIKNGGYNNLAKSFDDLAELDLFEGKTSDSIRQHYYYILKRDHSIFNLSSEISNARMNYKNDPMYWRRVS